MNLKIYSQPAVEPVSLQELKEHLRLDSGDFGDNLTTSQMVTPGLQTVTASYSIIGSYVDVLGTSALVELSSGAVGTGGTIDCKIQDSDDHVTFTDWVGGGFTQVSAANDNGVQQIAYTGVKQYIRVVAKVLVASSTFGVSCHKYSSDATEDAMLSGWITAARQEVERITRRALITQTWDMALDAWPESSADADRWSRTVCEILLPFGNLQSITSLAYTDDLGVATTLTATTDYLVDTFSEPGRLVLPPGVSWPSSSLYPVNPIMIRFVCGYGATSASVPWRLRAAIKMMAADLYANRESQTMGNQQFVANTTVDNLLASETLRAFG